MRLIYLILISFAAPVAAILAWFRGLGDPARRERLADRFGRPLLNPKSPVLWVHAASMGEVQAAGILIRRLLIDYPRHEIVVTTMTTTGAARSKAMFAERVSHCFLPYDLPFAVRGFLDRCKPAAGIILETELWPTLLEECKRRAIGIVIASARISPRTAGRYRKFAGLFRSALSDAEVLAQSEADAERFRGVGARSVQTAGNLKFDIDVGEKIRSAGNALRLRFGSRFVWVAGSTHEGEEFAALEAHRALLKTNKSALLVLAPRHPQRFDDVRALLQRSGLPHVARSSGIDPADNTAVLLVDSMGELLQFYAAANAAFVGGSLAPIGGHNLLEPIALGVPTYCGPNLANAQDVADSLRDAQAISIVTSGEELGERLVTLMRDATRGAQMAANGIRVIEANKGAADRVLRTIERIANARG